MRRRRAPNTTQLVEVVTPRTNSATITPAENGFASISPGGAYGFEIAATRASKRFLLRAEGRSEGHVSYLAERFAAAYAQAELRAVASDDDPVRQRPGERVLSCVFRLGEHEYLPIRTFSDLDVDDARSSQADPVLGLLAAMGSLPHGWRALAQLSCSKAPAR